MVPSTLMIDRRFRGVGRIKRASGTKIPAVKRKIERMLKTLHEDGRLDILRHIRDRQLSFLEVLDAFQRRRLDQLPIGDTIQPLAKAFEAWVDSLMVPVDYSADHVSSMRTTINYLKVAKADAPIADAPVILERLRDSLGRDYPRSFNLVRSHVMAFFRVKFKRSHPLWLACSAVEPRKVPKTTKRTPLTPDQMRNWFPSPDMDRLDAIAWGMATTGMHQKEYWGRWETRADRIEIHGTKREGRHRSVPLVLAPAVPAWKNRQNFEKALRERTRAFTPYDFRRTYANWLESSGIPRTRRKLYMGHGPEDVTDLYEQHEVEAFLAEDAAKLRAFLKVAESADVRLKAVKS